MENLDWTLSDFLKKNERVLFCCLEDSAIGQQLAAQVSAAGGISDFWKPDYRWSGLLRLVFTGRYKAIAGPAELLLGLSKLSKQSGTPLYLRHVILIGDCPDWIWDAISDSLDCRIWHLPVRFFRQSVPEDIRDLQDQILRWSSVLDCRVVKGSYGLEMQIVTFPGKKLPQFPTCAKLDIQPFEMTRHVPFYIAYNPKNPGIYMNNH